MKQVVILGAGSSHDLNLPLGNEIWSYAYKVSPHIKEIVRDFLDYVAPPFNPRFTKQNYPTFEVILTLLDLHINNKEKNWGKYSLDEIKEIKREMMAYYSGVFHKMCISAIWPHMDPPDYKKKYSLTGAYEGYEGYYKPFMSKIIQNKRADVTFISLNYDILLDYVFSDFTPETLRQLSRGEVTYQEVAKELKINPTEFTYGIKTFNIRSQKQQVRTSGILFLKPHGSINWAICPQCNKIFIDPEGHDSLLKSLENDRYQCDKCNIELQLSLLPPTYGKRIDEPPYNELHNKIIDAISAAEEITIIGYSLPDYDINILQSFLKGVAENPKRSSLKVSLIDPDCNLRDKYSHIFNKISTNRYYSMTFREYINGK